MIGMWFSVDRRVRFLHKQEKAAGSETLRGGVTPPGKAGWRDDMGRLQAVTGSLHFSATGLYLRCSKNDFFEIYGGGMVSHILRYYFAPFIRFEMIKAKEHRFGRIFSPKRCFFCIIILDVAKAATPIWYFHL